MEPLYSMNGALHSPPAQPIRNVIQSGPFSSEQGGAAPQMPEPGFAQQGSKRRKTDPSRAVMSYPRKRAVTACQLCRHRKTKCNNARPKCKICADAGADCVYEDRADLSSFDPASLLMLQRLNEILERLDTITPNQGIHGIGGSQHSVPDYASSFLSQAQAGNVPDEEYMRIPAFRTSPDKVLQWPIFDGKFEPECLVEKLFEAGCEHEPDDALPDSQTWRRPSNQKVSWNWREDDIKSLVENFLLLVHIKNPILDVDTLKLYAMHVTEEGLDWDGRSCLVLLACALGALVKPFQSTCYLATDESISSTPDSLENCRRELQTAASYFAMARKRIGLLDGTIIRAQCFFLSGVYLMYILRPLEAWQNFHQASTTYHVYLKGRTKASNVSHNSLMRTRRLEQRLFWSCFKSECEIRIELSLPESSIVSMSYPDMFPSPPTEEHDGSAVLSPNDSLATMSSSETHPPAGRRTTSFNNQNQQQSWYYYLSEIALRRIGNCLLNSFYKNDDYPGSGMTVPEMIVVAMDFENQLSQWHEGLPDAIRFDQSDFTILPDEELPYMMQARQLDYMVWMTKPFLYYAIHHLPSDPYQNLVQPFVEKALKYSIAMIIAGTTRHRHHGTFYGIRSGTAAALSILAAAKTGYISMLPSWKMAVRTQILTHKYWERESPDIGKARQILELLLGEIEGSFISHSLMEGGNLEN